MSALVSPTIERFGRFNLVRKIGQGGMAEVFAAVDTSGDLQGRDIVVKRLHKELESKREVVDLFTTEADVTLLLDHPGIVKVFESGEIDGRYFMVMEYVRGWTLEQLQDAIEAQKKPLSPDVALHIISRVLEVLHYVHNAKSKTGRDLGLVHRDVTPSNVYVTYEGQVKLGDFGVAKMVGMDSWTMAGSIKGKIGYLAPEQLLGKPPSSTIDRYAAAILLYELLTAKPCFVGDSELDVMLKIRDAKIIKPRKVRPDISRRVQRIVMKALRKWPYFRYKTSGEFQKALEDYRDHYGHRVLDADLLDVFSEYGLRVNKS